MAKCKQCDQAIEFVKLGNGKWHPVEARESEVFYFHRDQPGMPRVKIVTANGSFFSGRLGTRHENGVTRLEGWLSHFTSCEGREEAPPF